MACRIIFISIHAPLAGCDEYINEHSIGGYVFQSTHPLRGATTAANANNIVGKISIHAPLAGCDVALYAVCLLPLPFQSTHPLRGATLLRKVSKLFDYLFQSTHPLRGATGRRVDFIAPPLYFNPRTPCGVRLFPVSCLILLDVFQSTHPLRGATYRLLSSPLSTLNFNPRTPCGVRRHLR